MQIKLLNTFWMLMASITIALGQVADQERLSIVFNNVSLHDAIQQLDDKTKLDFAYDPSILKSSTIINVSFNNHSLREILEYLFSKETINYSIADGQIILTPKAQLEEFIINGYVEDKTTGEKLAYATVYVPEIERGVTANEHGYFSLKVPSGEHLILVGYVGRDEFEESLNVTQDVHKTFSLSNFQTLDEVIITPDAIQGSSSIHRSYQRKAIQELALQSPAVSGESDVLQIVRNLPGIESNAGGVGSMFVRGGEDDQNLVLMDGVPIYYPAHLLGIYSIFNAESVRNIEVYKGGFPARYGGRLSSVIDIHTKDGRSDGWHADISGSYQSVRGAIQGPLTKGVNLMIGGRQSLTAPFMNDVIGNSFYRLPGEDLSSNYNDINFKLGILAGSKGKFTFSAYSGKDVVEVEEIEAFGLEELSSNLGWSNYTLSLSYQRELGDNSFLKISQTQNSFLNEYEEFFEFEEEDEIEDIGEYYYAGTYSDNKDLETKISIDHFINAYTTNRYGLSYKSHAFTASTENLFEAEFGEVDSLLLGIDFFPRTDQIFDASSYAAFVEHERQFSNKLFANIGLRWSGMSSDDEFYNHLEPRVNLKYYANEDLGLNISISKMVQYIHQVSDANLSFPKDIWLPSIGRFPPSVSWQFGAGASKKFNNGMHLDVQAYLKDFQNLNYTPNIFDLTNQLNGNGLADIFTGKGSSYGLEISSELPFKNLHIANALTFSHTTRTFDPINGSTPFPFQYDRGLVFKSSISYAINSNLSLGARIYLGSATPEYFVNPEGRGQFSFFNLTPTDPDNRFRASWHQRLDLSATYTIKSGYINHHLKANLYNILNLQNPGFTYKIPHLLNSTRRDVFALPFIPSVQYNISF